MLELGSSEEVDGAGGKDLAYGGAMNDVVRAIDRRSGSLIKRSVICTMLP
jgi:hypothetical protein